MTMTSLFMKMILHPFVAVLLTLQAVAAEKQAAFHWGVNGHPLMQAAYFDVPLETQFDLVEELGAGWYRFSVGPQHFAAQTARMDRLLELAEKRGIKLLPVLLPADDFWDGTAAAAQLQVEARAFAKSVVERYKGRITHWELANEPDAYALIRQGETTRSGKLWEWEGAPDGSAADDYHEERYQRARAVIAGLQEGVKAADPQALTLVDTAGWLHYGFIDRLANEDKVPFDVLAWHWYSEMGDMTRVRGDFDLLKHLKSYGKPLWITEINRRDGSKGGHEKEAAAYLGEAAQQLRADPRVEAFFVYELLDQPYFGPEGESAYGLVNLVKGTDDKWQPGGGKASYAALQSIIRHPAFSAGSPGGVILQTPDLVAFWDFQEETGQPRVSQGGARAYALQEQRGPVERVEGGVFGKHAARIQRGQWLMVPRAEIGELDIHGKDAQVTVIAWIKRRDRQVWQALAGAWDETHKKRQYCLFLYGGTATRADEMKRYPVKDRIHGHVSAVGGPTPGEKFCITYSTGATEIGFGKWHCVAMSYDGKASRVYVNGKLDAWEQRNPFPYPDGLFDGGEDGADFTVGAVHRGGEWGNFFGGDIGGVAVFKRALSDGELLKIATETLEFMAE